MRTGNDVSQLGKHLAAVAHAQSKGIGPAKKALELVSEHGVEGDGARPANACAQGVAITEATASHHPLEVGQVGAACLQVGHVHVKGLKPCFSEGISHFHMRVHALLTQHGHFGARQQNGGRIHVRFDCHCELDRQSNAPGCDLVCPINGY